VKHAGAHGLDGATAKEGGQPGAAHRMASGSFLHQYMSQGVHKTKAVHCSQLTGHRISDAIDTSHSDAALFSGMHESSLVAGPVTLIDGTDTFTFGPPSRSLISSRHVIANISTNISFLVKS